MPRAGYFHILSRRWNRSYLTIKLFLAACWLLWWLLAISRIDSRMVSVSSPVFTWMYVIGWIVRFTSSAISSVLLLLSRVIPLPSIAVWLVVVIPSTILMLIVVAAIPSSLSIVVVVGGIVIASTRTCVIVASSGTTVEACVRASAIASFLRGRARWSC